MGVPVNVLVDVRDMMCAQALAVVAQTFARLPTGEAIDVRYNAKDVHYDLLAWARDGGYRIYDLEDSIVRLAR